MKKLLSLKEVAERLNVSVFTAQRLIRRGQIPAAKIGNQWRIEEDALELYIKTRASGIGDVTVSQLYFRPEVLYQFYNDLRYYVQEEGSRGRVGLKVDRRMFHAYKSTKYLLDKDKQQQSLDKPPPELFTELYFWKVKLKNGQTAIMVQPRDFYRIPESVQNKWLPYAIQNPQI